MLTLLANSPSSGSTFLADLLDSTPVSACGVEINIFGNKRFYDYDSFRTRPFSSSSASSLYVARVRTNIRQLSSYGLDREKYIAMAHECHSPQAFAEKFRKQFMRMRGKPDNAILFEETPQNINCMGEFLEAFPDAHIIHLVRNPLYVYPSLVKRGFPPFIALATWLIDVAKYYQYRDHPRTHLVKYEALVEDPYTVAAGIIHTVSGKTVDPAEIETSYKNNDYRRSHSVKISTWSNTGYGQVNNANRKQLTAIELNKLSGLWNMQVSENYALLNDIYPLSFRQALHEFGYYDEVAALLEKEHGIPGKTARDRLFLGKKWLAHLLLDGGSISSLPDWLSPLKPAENSKPDLS